MTMYSMVRVCAVLAILLGLSIEGHCVKTSPDTGKPTVEAYVTMALDKLEEAHINRDQVDWKAIRVAAAAKVAGAKTYEDAYPIIRDVIRQLGERHSFFVAARPSQPPSMSAPVQIPPVLTRAIGDAGYIRIPTFAISEPNPARAFAVRIRDALVESNEKGACGWIVDLRQNMGGNIVPALLGLGPLVGEGMLGGVIGARSPQYWHYMSNRLLISDEALLLSPENRDADPDSRIVHGVREIIRINSGVGYGLAGKPVAVLVGPRTASSGEGIAMVLMGRDKARSFGEQTMGLTSGNIGVKMPDGAMLIITAGHFIDRRGRPYRAGVMPDETIEDSPESDKVLDRALEWLGTQGCRSFRYAPGGR